VDGDRVLLRGDLDERERLDALAVDRNRESRERVLARVSDLAHRAELDGRLIEGTDVDAQPRHRRRARRDRRGRARRFEPVELSLHLGEIVGGVADASAGLHLA
jgi:hypothetical protein